MEIHRAEVGIEKKLMEEMDINSNNKEGRSEK